MVSASNLCTKCGAAWNGETGKYPCAGGGKCDIPAARSSSTVLSARQRCSNCGYTKGSSVVLVPSDRCPSCGAYSFGKGS